MTNGFIITHLTLRCLYKVALKQITVINCTFEISF